MLRTYFSGVKFFLFFMVAAGALSAQAGTVAHWDFSSTNAVNGAFIPGNGCRADLDGDGTMDFKDFRISAVDLSGNGNHLTVWASEWMKWSADSVRGDFSLKNDHTFPCASTDSAFNPSITGTDVETITPAAWTVEALFKLDTLVPCATVVGRDGRFPDNCAAFYLSVRGSDLAVQYKDVDGADHNLQVLANIKPNIWYGVAAVSDGSTLFLYLNGKTIGMLDLTETDTEPSLGLGYGIWSVGRGMWAEDHVDRLLGVIDEVAVSDQALQPASFVIPLPVGPDSDGDGMSDQYEDVFRLWAIDSQQDLDGDTLTTFAESILFTDPRVADTDTDGLSDDIDQAPLSRAVMLWWNADYMQGDAYVYPGPDWWLGAQKSGGVWVDDIGWTVAPGEQGLLLIDIDRSLMTNNLVLSLLHHDVAECSVYLDLGEADGTVAAENLFGDIADGGGSEEMDRFFLPLADYPTASRIVIDATAGVELPYILSVTTLCVDEDADALDVHQEIQLRTSDTNPDSDGDGLEDGVEFLVQKTDPADADTDRDGLTDFEELSTLNTSPFIPIQQEGGLPGCLQVERWYNIEGADVSALVNEWRFGARPDSCVMEDSTEYAPDDTAALEYYGIRMRGTITAPASGTYVFRLTGDDHSQFWLSDSESPYERRLVLDLQGWTRFRDLADDDVPYAFVELVSGETYYFEILLKERAIDEHVTLWWTRPGQSTPEIIGADYLHSYVQPADDSDGDGLPDVWEDEVGFGDPNLPNGGGLRDADGDGYSDFIEYTLGLNPTMADEDGDGLSGGDELTVTLTDQNLADTDGDGVPDLSPVVSLLGADFISCLDTHIWTKWSTDGTNAIVDDAHSDPWITYSLPVDEGGIYCLAIDAESSRRYENTEREIRLIVEIDGIDLGEIWMNHSDSLPAYTLYTPWLSAGTHELKITVRYHFWNDCDCIIHGIELGAVDGADADGNGIQDWMEAILAKGLDTDGDGITDEDEVALGTDVTGTDFDGDGLSDGEELAAGTDPFTADSDGDGVSDGVEVKETLTNPLFAEFDGTVADVLILDGANTNAVTGSWSVSDTSILSESRRGELSYSFTLPTQDVFRVQLDAAHLWNANLAEPSQNEDTSELDFYVDGIYIGTKELVSMDGDVAAVQVFLPVLSDGEHTLTVFWENLECQLVLKVDEVHFQQLGGPDNNDNGIKDWVEASLNAMAGIDGISNIEQGTLNAEVLQSYISPACLEGDARYVSMMSLVSQASSLPCLRSAGARWYANVPLNENDETDVSVSFQNGALEVPVSVTWKPYNLIDYDGETLFIRKDDALRLTCIDPARAFDDLEHARGGRFTLNVLGDEYTSNNTRPVTCSFTNVGVFTVSGEYTHGKDTITASVIVQVLDGSFPEESPACHEGMAREWIFCGIPENIVFETDNTVQMEVIETALTTNNLLLTTCTLLASEVNGEHAVVARLYEGGPILDSTDLHVFWLKTSVGDSMRVVDFYEDSQLWESVFVGKNLPDSLEVLIDVFGAGILLDDYTVERWIGAGDFSSTGEYKLRLFHPNDRTGSACFSVELSQDGMTVGAP